MRTLLPLRRGPFLMLTGVLILFGPQVHAQVDPLWDHYRIYVAPGPTAATTVTLEDQFGVWSYSDPTLLYFANPDQKTHGGVVYPINDPRLHYTWWALGADAFEKPGLLVDNQFGTQQVHVSGNGTFLLNPATKNETGPIPIANHYKCYRCSGVSLNVSVLLEDQFTTRTVILRDPFWFCNPAKKTVAGVTDEIVDPDQHYVCYSMLSQAGDFSAVVSDQFVQNYDLNIKQNIFHCVPSVQTSPTPARRGTWGRVKVIYR